MAVTSALVLGIDLGTTYSTAAAVLDGRIHFILDARGEACIPSVVHFPKGRPPIVGAEASKLRATDPQNTVFGIKRLVGKTADSPAARLLDACSAFKIKPQPSGEALVAVRAGDLPASEVAAIILRHLRERAEARFGRKIDKAVLTVPVTASAETRAAMIACGRMAGMEVLRIVSEPCSGGVARGANWGDAPLLVYDFGGGTFDATVVRKAGRELKVLSSGGDDCLGGDDFDMAFARWVASGVYRAHGVEATKDVILWNRIQHQCELVKRALSGAESARYTLPDALGPPARRIGIDVVVQRQHVTPLWQELVDRSIAASIGTVEGAGIPIAELAGVLLIGGTTYIPQVRDGVAAAIPRTLFVEEDPQTAVARGAALLGAHPELLAD